MSDVLGLGKVTREVFNRCVLPYIPTEKDIELDGATTSLSGKTVIAHSPSIGVPLEALGFFAFHYSASNVASKFGRPSHIISGIYLPLRTTEGELRVIAKSLGDEAKKYGVTVTAGQTATYYGLDIPLMTATCLGESIRAPTDVHVGDKVLLVGEVGGEAVWLDKLSKDLESDEVWRQFTPLPAILMLQNVSGVKFLHDVSEGGVKGSLFEVATSSCYGLNVSTQGVMLYPGAEKLHGDLMRAPSYSTLIAIAEPDSVKDIQNRCNQLGVYCSVIGETTSETGLIFDGEQISEQKRIDLDEIYGSFAQKDELLDELQQAFDRLIGLDGLVGFIPEVGLNMVYAKPDARTPDEVAGLSGRVIKAMNRVQACGEVVYGASRYLASVILEAQKHNKGIRAAVNISGETIVQQLLEFIGLRVYLLPSKIEGEGCPVTIHLETADTLYDAYLHPGDFGIEPTTTILGESPRELVDILEKLVSLER